MNFILLIAIANKQCLRVDQPWAVVEEWILIQDLVFGARNVSNLKSIFFERNRAAEQPPTN